jgi:Ubiquitin family.
MQETSNSNLMAEETKSGESIRHLKIATLDQQVFHLEVSPSVTIIEHSFNIKIAIRELKKEIEKKTSVPYDRQRLIYQAKMLNDDQALDSIIKEDGQTIHLLAKVQQSQTEPQAQNTTQQSQPQPHPNTQTFQTQQTSQNPNPNINPSVIFGASGLPGNLNINNLLSGLMGGLNVQMI